MNIKKLGLISVPVIIGGLLTGLLVKPTSSPNFAENQSPILIEPKQANIAPAIVAQNQTQTIDQQESTIDSNSQSNRQSIIAGQTETAVCSDQLSPGSEVYLTTENDKTNQILFVKRKVPFNPETNQCAHFVAAIPKPVDHDLEFTWYLIDRE